MLTQLFQLVQRRPEALCVNFNGFADEDLPVGGAAQPLLHHQFLLIEFFSRAQAGVLDLDVHVWHMSRQLDQVSGQVVDLDRISHVQHKYLAALGIGAGLKHQSHRLRDGHEIADDIRVGDSDRTAGLDLLLEQRDH